MTVLLVTKRQNGEEVCLAETANPEVIRAVAGAALRDADCKPPAGMDGQKLAAWRRVLELYSGSGKAATIAEPSSQG